MYLWLICLCSFIFCLVLNAFSFRCFLILAIEEVDVLEPVLFEGDILVQYILSHAMLKFIKHIHYFKDGAVLQRVCCNFRLAEFLDMLFCLRHSEILHTLNNLVEICWQHRNVFLIIRNSIDAYYISEQFVVHFIDIHVCYLTERHKCRLIGNGIQKMLRSDEFWAEFSSVI